MTDNKNSVRCPLCDKGDLEERVMDYRTILKEGDHFKRILVKKLTVEVCANCKEIILPKESLERVYNERHSRRHLLTTDELKKVRRDLGLTQSRMSELLGIGKKSYLRWEKGSSLQSRSMDRYIRLLRASPDNAEFLKKL